jgi:hypothetical protein
LTRLHNDANVLTLSSKFTAKNQLEQIVKVFLETKYEGGRHVVRLEKIRHAEEVSMSHKPGATILILFYVLWIKDLIEKEFDADDLFHQYIALRQDVQHQRFFNYFLQEYKKRKNKSDLDVLTTAAKLKSWLKKHSGKKPRKWFEYQKDKFKLRSELVEELMSHMNLSVS